MIIINSKSWAEKTVYTDDVRRPCCLTISRYNHDDMYLDMKNPIRSELSDIRMALQNSRFPTDLCKEGPPGNQWIISIAYSDANETNTIYPPMIRKYELERPNDF